MKDLDDILEIAAGYQVSKSLFAAVEFNVFNSLSGKGKTIKQLSSELKLPKRSLFRLLGVCTACGLLKKKDGKYYNSKAAERFLVENKPGYIGDFCKANNNFLYNSWGKIEEIIKSDKFHSVFGGKGDTIDRVAIDPKIVRVSHKAQHNYSINPAKELAEKFDFSKYKDLLDLGGGSGILSIMAVKKYPHLTATVFDFTPVCEIAKEIIAEHGVEDRVRTCPGNIIKDEFPKGADLILISGILDGYDEEGCYAMIKKAYDYLPKGGGIILKESIIDDGRTGPLFPAIFSLALLIETRGGDSRSRGEMSGWLKKAGFTGIKFTPLHEISGSYRALGIVTAKKA
ncbi:MAG: hypothetical protein A2042_05205 [Candidatus Schekmanbacteria bacterium GWA2_38_11]|uniref:Methyltransferase n=1 Tax=Candidatus Schekmanbacteria bacterium GWA2_38_11 TaxID=1817876 RepID=A0A1F7RMS8_9BACT|nr:MAG: hypothetical protein A2042_05205 [Candidatus Schekmanbacteria bacterium GWA2_38_11]